MWSKDGKIVIAALAGFSAALLSLPTAFGADAPKKNDGKVIFEQKCLKCHKIEKFKETRNDRRGWEMVLKRMERNSCILTKDEANAVATYLSTEYGE